MEKLPGEKGKLNFFQMIRKKILLKNITLPKYEKKNFPMYLKNDIDILCALAKQNCYSLKYLSEEQQRMIIEHMPEVILDFGDVGWDAKKKFIDKCPQAIVKIFDKLSSDDKESFLIDYPEYIRQLNRDSAIGFILGGLSAYYLSTSREFWDLIVFIPEDMQVKLLTETVTYIDDIRESNRRRSVNPNNFINRLDCFSEKAVIEAVRILNERAKTETRDKVPLLKDMEIHNLPVDMQVKLVKIDNELINQMSAEAIVKYLDNNALIFLGKLDTKKQIDVIKLKPEYFKVLSHEQKKCLLEKDEELKKIIPDIDKIEYRREIGDDRFFNNVEEIKEYVVRRTFNLLNDSRITEYVRDKDALIELARFKPSVLGIWGIVDSFKEKLKFEQSIELCKMQTQNPVILEALEELNEKGYDDSYSYKMMNIAKVLLNKKVMSTVAPEVIAEFIRDENIEKLKNIIVQVYGEQIKGVFEDRPEISMEQIHNLDIFDEKVIEKFGIGAIHNMLSYKSHTPAIVGELVRNPELMEKFEIFSKIVGDYFKDTTLGLENKLISFYRIRELFLDVALEDFTPERIKRILIAINDMNMTYNLNETSIISLKTLEDLDRYEENRNKMYDSVINQLESPKAIKDLLFRKFFGVPYGETICSHEIYMQNNLTIQRMLYFYNIETFVSDERTQNSKLFTEEEIDQLELLTIIHKIQDIEVLKELYKRLDEMKEKILRPEDFTAIKNKIPEQYAQVLIDTLLTVEDAKRRAEEGEEGISYIQTEDGYEIIKLHGADFRICMHSAGINNSGLPIPKNASPDDVWKYFEDGCSTVSTCIIEPEVLHSCDVAGKVNLGFANMEAKQIIGMGHTDIHVTHFSGEIDPFFEFGKVKFNYPDELLRRTAAQISGQERKDEEHPYNEVTMYRNKVNSRQIRNGTLGGAIMPDYIVVYGEVNDYHKKMARKFSINEKPIPIIQIDIAAYPDRTYIRGARKEEHRIERKSGEVVKIVKEIADMEER